ncbi:MAG TPA: VOC family protein [Ktedonobacteraceae bacterium]|nr:VOC family protein [Ktedonobacteraceae bacterium]
MKVLFVAGFGPVVTDMQASQAFYGQALGLPLEGDETYLFAHGVDGVKHFALWPLSAAAQSCFGTDTWPQHLPMPQSWIEFDVEDVAAATAELENKGYQVLLATKQEPWGQTVTRLLGPDNFLVGITYTPALR